jgi:UvrD/REP helicase N-terminal domain
MPESRIDDLNPEQLRAATAGEGPVLTIAGAGTGKTKTLAARMAWLVSQGIDPGRIMLLAFTRRLRTRCCAGRGEPWVRPEAARSEPPGWHLSLRCQPVAAHLWGSHRAGFGFYRDGSIGCRGSSDFTGMRILVSAIWSSSSKSPPPIPAGRLF